MPTGTRWYHLIAYFFGGAFLANKNPSPRPLILALRERRLPLFCLHLRHPAL